MKATSAIILLLAVLHGIVWSQEDDTAQSSSPRPWRVSINGDSGSLAFWPETEELNLLSVGLSLSSTYDDNALSSSSNRIGSIGYMVAPSLAITEARARTFLVLTYDPAFVWNQRSFQRYEANHNLDFYWQYRFTEHLTTRIHENFTDQSTSFKQFNENPTLPGGNVLHDPNPSVITPLATQVTTVTKMDLVDQIGESTNIGISGDFNKLTFKNTSNAAAPLFDSLSWSGDAFYQYNITKSQVLGATYSFQKIATFGSITEHTQSQSVLLFYRLDCKPGLTLSLFAGPDLSIAEDRYQFALGSLLIPVHDKNSRWLVDGGATFSWQGQRNSARLNLIHHVTDGGGLVGAVEMYSGTLGLRRQLSKAWTGEFDVTYGDNNPLNHIYGYAFRGFSGTVGVDRQVGSHFSVGMRYGRDFQLYRQFQLTGNPTRLAANHNRGWINLAYQFSRPLGR